jgi:prepilin-type N-terminal cleavage/methylation domain-containing protein
MMKAKNNQAGFTLVEIALALVVVALGVVGIFALVPQASEASRKSVDATELAVFADFVFESLQIKASNLDDDEFKNFQLGGDLRANLSHAWIAVENTQTYVQAAGWNVAASSPRIYRCTPDYYGEGGGGTGSGGSDPLHVEQYEVAQYTYTLHVTNNFAVVGVDEADAKAMARLEVWPGDRRAAVAEAISANTSLPGSYVFYREFKPIY